MRLVKETDPERMLQRILTHIRAQGFHVLMNAEPDDQTRARYPQIVRISRIESTKAFRTDMTLPESQALIRTLERVWGEPPVRNRTMGGTVPIDFFIQALNMPAIMLPVVNFDNNQHSNNENLRLQNLWDAVVSFAATLRCSCGCEIVGFAPDFADRALQNSASRPICRSHFTGRVSLNPADFSRQLAVTSRIIQPSPQHTRVGSQGQ